MNKFEFPVGVKVWVPDPKECFIGCIVKNSFKPGEEGVVVDLESRNAVKVCKDSSQKVCFMDEDTYKTGVDDMVEIKELNEATLLNNLHLRFQKDLIYTKVGSILVSINPFKMLPIYTPSVMEYYQKQVPTSPHIFGVAQAAFDNLLQYKRDQSIVISGESGAGKSETTKLFLQYLADVSLERKNRNNSLQHQIVQASPLMEAFGNAKTVRNNNSSRFGKWIQIKFNSLNGTMQSGEITSYLLEKSRIVHQSLGEQNYHVFYQLFVGVEYDEAKFKRLQLKKMEHFHYLNQGGGEMVKNIKMTYRSEDWKNLQAKFKLMGVSDHDVELCEDILAGILHLGNITFSTSTKENETLSIENNETLVLTAKLFGVPTENLRRVLTLRSMGVRSIIYKPYTYDEAKDTRDALAKSIYGNLFDWLIEKVNHSLLAQEECDKNNKSASSSMIGILDIFGFESFQTNSFEQLCINYCNEKLQQHFNSHIFQMEQLEYEKEEINISQIKYTDNQPCLDVLECKTGGVFALIDEEINIPKGNDMSLLNKILNQNSQKQSKIKRTSVKSIHFDKSFVVEHYAGQVVYHVDGFLEKNKDLLHNDLKLCMQKSNNKLINHCFNSNKGDPAETINDGGKHASLLLSKNRKQPTLGAKFKSQLKELLHVLNETEPHFIRCIKPNEQKVANCFSKTMVLHQLQCAGLLEVCKIRKIGYPTRFSFKDFLFKYGILGCHENKKQTIGGLCESLLKQKLLTERDDWEVGKTKIFMRYYQRDRLNQARDKALGNHVIKIQAVLRGYLARKQFYNICHLIQQLENTNEIDKLEDILYSLSSSSSSSIPEHLEPIVDAKQRLSQLREYKHIDTLLKQAIGSGDEATLKMAIESCEESIVENYDNLPNYIKAKQALTQMEMVDAIRQKINTACDSKDLSLLNSLLSQATNLFGLSPDHDENLKKALVVQKRLSFEHEFSEQLDHLIQNGSDLNAFHPVLDQLTTLKVDDDLQKRINSARSIYSQLYKMEEAKRMHDLEEYQQILYNLPPNNRPAKSTNILKQLELEEKIRKALDSKSTELKEIEELVVLAKQMNIDNSILLSLHKRIDSIQLIENVERCLVEDDDDVRILHQLMVEASKLQLNRKEYPVLDVAHKKLLLVSNSSVMNNNKDGNNDDELMRRINECISTNDIENLEKLVEQLEESTTCDEELLDLISNELEIMQNERDFQASISMCTSLEQVQTYCTSNETISNFKSGLIQSTIETAKKINNVLENVESHNILELIQVKELGEQAKLLGLVKRVDKAIERKRTCQVLENELEEAMQVNDKKRMMELLNKIDNVDPNVQVAKSARLMLERELKLKEMYDLLQSAMDKQNLEDIDEATNGIIHLCGEIKPEMKTKVASVRKNLEGKKRKCAEIIAATKLLEGKSQNPRGITPSDLQPIKKALGAYKSDKSVYWYENGVKLMKKMERQLEIQFELNSALASGNLESLKKGLDMAEMEQIPENIESFAKVKNCIRKMNPSMFSSAFLDQEEKKEEQEEKGMNGSELEGFEQANALRRKKSQHPRFHFGKYHRIRSDQNYAKGTSFFQKKSKVIQTKLCYQNSLIHRSLIDFDSNRKLEKIAISLNRSILGYCREKSFFLQYPAMLAYDILLQGQMASLCNGGNEKTIDEDENTSGIEDEIYLQLCKHITNNPRPESLGKAWQLVSMACGTFAPSKSFELYLINFLQSFENIPGLIGNYARYSIRRLGGLLNDTHRRGEIPSSPEALVAYSHRPPILTNIRLADGTFLAEDLPITPDLDVGAVNRLCIDYLGLVDERSNTFGISIDGGLPLMEDQYLGDEYIRSLQKKNPCVFTFKRNWINKNCEKPSEFDKVYNRLMYLQTMNEFLAGNFKKELSTNKKLETKLVSMIIAIQLGENFPTSQSEIKQHQVFDDVLKNNFSQSEKNNIADKVLLLCGNRDAIDTLEIEFVDIVKKFDYFGSIQLNTENYGLLSIGFEGITIIENGSHYPFESLQRWCGTEHDFTVVIWDPETEHLKDEIVFETKQGSFLGDLILRYINYKMSFE